MGGGIEDKPTIQTWLLYIIMLGMLIAGSSNTILTKVQDGTLSPAPKAGYLEPMGFNQPYWQSFVMFNAELVCLALYGLRVWFSKKDKSVDGEELMAPQLVNGVPVKTNINPVILAIPAACDFTGSTLMNFALILCPASIYQMMRGFVVIVVAVMSVVFLKRKQYRHHWTSLAVLFTGVFLVGLSSILDDGETAEGSNTGLGIIMILIAQLFVGVQFCTEEKLLGDYVLDPMKVVGLEGMWGVVYCLIVLPIFGQIPCSNNEMCPYGYMASTNIAFEQYANNGLLILESFLIIVSMSSFNATGLNVTKYGSCAQRSTIDTSRTVIVWVFFMLVQDPRFHESFSWL
jgi:drug/metabolite transporter (DMT)-like permease